MINFRLNVFNKVAEKLSFTKAAKELFITQPAVTKHINALEQEFNNKFFNRKGNSIELTEAGKILHKYVKDINKLYNQLNFELNALNQTHKGKLRIGTSTTITQYVLPKLMANFKSKFNDLTINVISGNTEQIEKALFKNEIDLGIIEGQSKRSDFNYLEFLKDEIVLVTKSAHKLAKVNKISLDELKNYPLVLRENGSGTLEVINYYLKQNGLNLSDFLIELRFGSTEGIKNYILHSESLAFLSIQSILNEINRNELSIIHIDNFEINRSFNFIYPIGQQNKIVNLFIQFASHYNF